MTSIRFAKSGCLLFIAAGLAYYAHAQTAQRTPSVQEFYQTLVDHYDPSSLPPLETVERVTNQIAGARPNEIAKVLPAVFAALAHQDETVKHFALTALYMVALRPDGAALLRSHINAIGSILTSPIPETRAGAILVLGTLKPVPPPEVVPIFLTFLKRTDADAQAQGSGIIFELVHIAPENPEVIAAIREFLSRPLDSKSRREALTALGDPRVKDAQIIAMMIASLDDPDQWVRATAIENLMGMRRDAVLQQAEPALQRLANDPKQPPEVTAAAKDALQKLHPPQR
jgi:HEAT repeat protein